MSDANREQLLSQAASSPVFGSPFTGAVCALLAERLDRTTDFGRRILDWPGNPHADALALRACGALNALARSGREPLLRAAYPPAAFDAEKLWGAITGALTREDAFLTAFLDSPPQTNEVARSSMILGGALRLAQHVRMPLSIYEIGASAGLNLGFDRYRYDLGEGRTWGALDAPLTIRSSWRGNSIPLDAPLEIVSRQGCDKRPLDPADPVDAERLMAYIWPDQAHRVERTEAALRVAAAEGRKVEQIDAAAWAERELAKPQQAGTCRLLYHTIVWQYLAADTRARIDAALAGAAARATTKMPLAHFALETDNDPDGANTGAPMTLTIWPGGQTQRLGRGDDHGRWVAWT
jgi:hypothetical protein